MLSTLNTSEAVSQIRPIYVHQLQTIVPFAQQFHAEMKLPGELKPDIFVKNWTMFLTQYPAVILGLWRKAVVVNPNQAEVEPETYEQVYGAIAGMIVPDLLDGRLCASEFFWFVSREHRYGMGAIRLLDRFERWSAENGAVEIRMVHLKGNNDEQLARIYEKRGYKLQELCYWKALKGR